MAEFTHNDLKKARETRKMSRAILAEIVFVSEDTLERWESGKSRPDPEDVDRIGEALGDKTLWHKWMLSNYDSYRKRYIDAENYDLPIAIMKSRYELTDVLSLQDAVERGAITGQIDDPILKEKYRKEVQGAIASLSAVLQKLG